MLTSFQVETFAARDALIIRRIIRAASPRILKKKLKEERARAAQEYNVWGSAHGVYLSKDGRAALVYRPGYGPGGHVPDATL